MKDQLSPTGCRVNVFRDTLKPDLSVVEIGDYYLKPPLDPLPFSSWQEAKEKRKKQLAEVRTRRRLIYELMRKMQQSKNSEKSGYFKHLIEFDTV